MIFFLRCYLYCRDSLGRFAEGLSARFIRQKALGKFYWGILTLWHVFFWKYEGKLWLNPSFGVNLDCVALIRNAFSLRCSTASLVRGQHRDLSEKQDSLQPLCVLERISR